MKVKIKRNTVAAGVTVNEGQVIDLPETEARFLIQIGKAEAVETADAPKVETADASPEMETTNRPNPKSKKAK